MNAAVSIIIVAGGRGSRMLSELPKQFIAIDGKPIFIHSIMAFVAAFAEAELVLVLPEAHIHLAQTLMDTHLPQVQMQYIVGGDTRYHSVAHGLAVVTGEVVMVHDAVRPFIHTSLLHTLYTETLTWGNAVPAIPAVDSVRMVDAAGNKALDRSSLRIIQTPQSFLTADLKRAYTTGFEPFFTDDASVVEAMGMPIHLVAGSVENIKITNPQDLHLAAYIYGLRG